MFFPITEDGFSKNYRVLVVEDVDFNLKILTGILAERGWQVVPAASGEAALDILAQDADFQIILMDIGLPGIDGLEATRRIKENPAISAIPVIALTAETAAERERFLAAGLDGYAEKNFDPEQLLAVIERHLFPDCGNHHGTNPIQVNPATHLDLNFEALLASYLNEESLCRIARAFFADTDKELLLLSKAMEAGKQTAILACCHSIRGAAAIFTASNLGLAAKELEDSISSGKKNESHSAWHRVRAAHASLRQIVSKRLNLEQKANRS